VPNLFAKDELMAIMETVTPRAKRAGKPLTPAGLYAFFVAQCRANLHLVLAMSPVGPAFRERLRTFPCLVACTTIDWFSEWPAEALASVAARFLHDVELPTDQVSHLPVCLKKLTLCNLQHALPYEQRTL
jgi:dynein heavy chain